MLPTTYGWSPTAGSGRPVWIVANCGQGTGSECSEYCYLCMVALDRKSARPTTNLVPTIRFLGPFLSSFEAATESSFPKFCPTTSQWLGSWHLSSITQILVVLVSLGRRVRSKWCHHILSTHQSGWCPAMQAFPLSHHALAFPPSNWPKGAERKW